MLYMIIFKIHLATVSGERGKLSHKIRITYHQNSKVKIRNLLLMQL